MVTVLSTGRGDELIFLHIEQNVQNYKAMSVVNNADMA